MFKIDLNKPLLKADGSAWISKISIDPLTRERTTIGEQLWEGLSEVLQKVNYPLIKARKAIGMAKALCKNGVLELDESDLDDLYNSIDGDDERFIPALKVALLEVLDEAKKQQEEN